MLPLSVSWICQEPHGSIRTEGVPPTALLSGSFNPLHDGHRRLVEVVRRRIGKSVAFELSVVNVDKPEIASEEIRRRLEQFIGLAPIYVTRAMSFEQKASLFPGCLMVVGADTAERILALRYYGNDPAMRDRSLSSIRQKGCRFFVGGRVDPQGNFVALDGIDIPEAFRDLFEGLEEEEFRVDVSSTLLRRNIIEG